MNKLTARIVLVVLVFQALPIGLWAAFAPRSFYDDFPTDGRSWVGVDGPYNEHLVRDVGALQIALAVLTLFALVQLSRGLVQATAVAWIAWAGPHLVYHFRHRDVLPDGDVAAVLGSSVLALGLAIVLLALPVRDSEPVAPSVQ